MKEIWSEIELESGLKVINRKLVKSHKRQALHVDIEAAIDRAVTIGMYSWTAVFSVAVAAVLYEIWG